MKVITAYIALALALIFGGIVVNEYAIQPAIDWWNGPDDSGNPKDNSAKIESDSGSIAYPTADILTFYSLSELEKAYPAPEGMEWVVNSDKGSGFATQSWYEKVWARSHNVKTTGDEGIKYNKYIAAAQTNQKVAYLREVDSNNLRKDYSDTGRQMTIVFRNNDGDLQIKDIPRSVDNFDLTSDVSDPNEVFKQPAPTVTFDQTTDFFQNLEKKLDERLNATAPAKDTETNVVKDTAAETPVVDPLAGGSYKRISSSTAKNTASPAKNTGSYKRISK